MAHSLKFVIFVKVVLYTATVITSLIVIAPLGITQNKHRGHCVLYAGSKDQIVQYGSETPCHYSIAVSAIFSLAYALAHLGIGALILRGIIKQFDKSELFFVINVLIDGAACILVLVSAGIISAGLARVCHNFVQDKSCKRASIQPVSDPSDKDYFYDRMNAAQTAAWVGFFLWLIQLSIGLFTLWRLNKLVCCVRSDNAPSSIPPAEIPSPPSPPSSSPPTKELGRY